MCAISALLFSVASGYTYFMYKSLERCFGSNDVCCVRICFGRLNTSTSKLTCIINGPFNPCYLPFRFGSFPRKDVPRPDFLKGVAGGW